MKEQKEMIDGYAVENSVWIGEKRIIFAIHPDKNEEYPYLKCVAVDNGIITRYENAVASDDYFEAMKLFADDIKAEAIIHETERRAIRVENPSCLPKEALTPVSWEDSIKNKVVARKPESLDHAYRDIAHQLYYVNSGFGVEPKSRGNACYGWNLYTGKTCRIDRCDVAGIVPEDKLPPFAVKTLADIQNGKFREEKESR